MLGLGVAESTEALRALLQRWVQVYCFPISQLLSAASFERAFPSKDKRQQKAWRATPVWLCQTSQQVWRGKADACWDEARDNSCLILQTNAPKMILINAFLFRARPPVRHRALFLTSHAADVCVCVCWTMSLTFTLDSIALHMDGLNQIPQSQWRAMFNGAEGTPEQLLRKEDGLVLRRWSHVKTLLIPVETREIVLFRL